MPTDSDCRGSDADTPGADNPLADSVGKAVDKAGDVAGGGGGDVGGLGGGGGSTTPSGDTSGPPPKGPDGKPMEPGVHYFTYTADVVFGPRGRTKTYDGMQELDLLPDGNSPVVAFMGVRSGKTAMFFIADPAFRADGEGTCSPSPDNCMFLFLKKDEDHNEETLSAQNGTIEFELKLTGLHVKRLSQDQVQGDTTPDKSSKHSAKRHHKTLLSLSAARVSAR